MHESKGRPHMLSSNQRGRGQEPVMVQGRMVLAVTVNMVLSLIPVWPVCKPENPRLTSPLG